MITAKMPVSTFHHSDNSTQHSLISDNHPMTSVNLSVSSAPDKMPVTVLQHSMTSNQQSVTSVKQPVTSGQQSLTSVEQPVTSIQQSLTSVRQPVIPVKMQETSAPNLDEVQKQQTLTSAQLQIGPALEYRVNNPYGFNEMPNPMVFLPAFQTIGSQEWVKVVPSLITYPCISVPPFQLPSVMFIANNSSPAQHTHQAHMTSMSGQA